MSDQEASELRKCQIWVLKVSIHCEGCDRQVKKVLNRIDGVYTTFIEAEESRVTVTGNVNVQTLIEQLNVRTGKHAELWPENLTTKEKTKPLKAICDKVECHTATLKKEKQCGVPKKHIRRKKLPKAHDPRAMTLQLVENEGYLAATSYGAPTTVSMVSQYSNDPNAVPVDLSQMIGNMYPIEFQSHLVSNGIKSCYDDQSSQYKGAAGVEHIDQVKATYLNSLDIFSDENADGCFIM